VSTFFFRWLFATLTVPSAGVVLPLSSSAW